MPVFLICTNAFAQTTKINGTVINQRTSAPASGATITVKSTNRSTTVGDDGRFSIEASKGDVLLVTMVGFQKTQIAVGKSSTIEIKLAENALELDDVVVIGYGKSKRRDITGSISSIGGDELRKTAPTMFDQALQGKVAGVMVQQVSGQPGGGDLRRRGPRSLLRPRDDSPPGVC